MSHWTRNARLATLAKERDLIFSGFRESLRQIVRQCVTWDDYLKSCAECEPEYLEAGEPNASGYEDCLKSMFMEWFGHCQVVPAAHRIIRDQKRINANGQYGFTIEVYEVENSIEISEEKLFSYGRIADGDGPSCDLHILDKYDHEIIIPCDYLMSWAFCDFWEEDEKRLRIKEFRARAKAQYFAPTIIDEDGAKERKTEIAKLRRALARTEHSKIAPAIQNIIYGLGTRKRHDDIARTAEISPAVVRSCARLLRAQKIDPTGLVRDTHARWKAAYDAVREMGIQI